MGWEKKVSPNDLTKVPPNYLGHMTKMATMPIYNKNTSNAFSRISGWIGHLHLNLVCRFDNSSLSHFFPNYP